MLRRLAVRRFKSLHDIDVTFPPMSVLFGPTAAGKSNLLDAISTLARVGTQPTLADALRESPQDDPLRLPELEISGSASFLLEADLTIGRDVYRYRVDIAIQPSLGKLSVENELLIQLNPRLRERNDRSLERVWTELVGWRAYDLDPRIAMREVRQPTNVGDIGRSGGDLTPFLYRLQTEQPTYFETIVRTLRTIVPSVENLSVTLDPRRGTLDLLIRHHGVESSVRTSSDGLLRVLALCAMAINPWGGSLLTIEEPANGIYPRRLELIAQLLLSLTYEQGRQVIVTTHSPLFCDAVLHHARAHPTDIGFFHVGRDRHGTVVRPLDLTDPLFRDSTFGTADGLFENLLLRGLLGE